MSFSKQYGPVMISENGGEFKLTVAIAQSAGGGSVAGFVKGSANIEVDLESKLLIDAGLDIVSAKFPVIAGEVAALKALVDAEIAKA